MRMSGWTGHAAARAASTATRVSFPLVVAAWGTSVLVSMQSQMAEA
jgi:hypothetical protein